MKRDPRTYHAIKMERHPNAELPKQSRSIRNWLEKSKIAHALLKVLAVFGVSLIIADGILTPAQSVLGAIQGLTVVDENIGSPTIIGVSCAILVLLFLLQPLGIQKLASCFAPIVILWLLFNASFGIYVSLETLRLQITLSDSCIRTWLCMIGRSSKPSLPISQVSTSCD